MGRLARLLSFQGRASRLGFWRWNLALSALSALLFSGSIVITMSGLPGSRILAAVPLVVLVLLLAPSLAVGARRLHDRGKGLWWLFVFSALPYLLDAAALALIHSRNIGVLLLAGGLALAALGIAVWGWIELGFLRGPRGPNRFGEAPPPLQ